LSARIFRRLLQDDRGAVLTEYATVTGVVALVTIPALLYCGVALAQSFAFVRDYVLYPFP
jgi:Flp pilus assembly pilin Flp